MAAGATKRRGKKRGYKLREEIGGAMQWGASDVRLGSDPTKRTWGGPLVRRTNFCSLCTKSGTWSKCPQREPRNVRGNATFRRDIAVKDARPKSKTDVDEKLQAFQGSNAKIHTDYEGERSTRREVSAHGNPERTLCPKTGVAYQGGRPMNKKAERIRTCPPEARGDRL